MRRIERTWKRRILSLLLAAVMTIGNLPVSALAEGQEVVEYSESTTLADYMEPQTANAPEVGEAEFYTISFIIENGEASPETVSTVEVPAGNAIGTLPEARFKDDYAFVGWFNGDTEITAETIPEMNIAAIAKYAKIHVITFIVEGEH